ncbi:MAG: PAS domain S-box protein [Solidesulfovibrio sp. DCME]|uniref:PAS domain S-box protein n=1 Tax=Solidesulfovibrio sp. DCME TaxID=3447380 RepID=UPI003D0EACB5
MTWPRLHSLRTRILLLVVLVLAPAIVLHVVSALEKRDLARKVAGENLQNITELVAANIETLLQSYGEALTGLTLLPEIRSMQAAAARPSLITAKEVFPTFSSITLLRPDGSILASTLPEDPAVNYADRPWVRRALTEKAFALGGFASGRRSGLPGLALACPVRDAAGDVVGVCVVALHLDRFSLLFSGKGMPPDSDVTLFDDTGVILADWPLEPEKIGALLPDAIQDMARAQGFPPQLMAGHGPDGKDFFFALARVTIDRRNVWFLRVGLPRGMVVEPLDAAMRFDLALFALVLAVALFFAHRFSRAFLLLPAEKLARMAKAMAVGDLDRRCDMGPGHGELSELGASLDAMAKALRERIRFTQEIMDAIPALVFYKDLDGRFLGVNKAFEESFLPLDAVRGKRCPEIGCLQLPAICDTTDRELLASPHRSIQFELTATFLDGSRHDLLVFKSIFYSASGTPAGIVGVALDISVRNRSEQALAASQARYRTLLTSMRDGFTVVDRDGRIVETNPAFCEMLGYDDEALRQMTYKDITPPAWHAAEEAILRESVDRRGFSDIFEKQYRRRDGLVIPVALRLHRYPVPAGDSRRYFAIVRDVTEAKAIETDLRAAKEEAEKANRAKSDFLAKMSHDIRTPLHAVIGMTELTLGTDLSPAQRDALETARESAATLLELINDILDISRIEARKLEINQEVFDLRRTLAATVRSLRPQAARKGLSLRLAVDPRVPRYVLGDQIRLRQILVNLVGNGIKFTEHGGVAVSLRPPSVSSASQSDAMLEFRVTDTGMGIAPERLSRIFDMFTQADASVSKRYGGTGLGLAICRELTRLMHGTIIPESTPGQGSAFHVTLPLPGMPPPEADEAPAVKPAALPGAPKALHILLAEDNPVNVKVATTYLGRRGHAFVTAPNGNDALACLSEAAFDVVLMDLEMPGCDGLEATRRLRGGQAGEVNRHIPVIAMTAHALSGVRQRCLEAGMTDYLSKPLDFKALDDLLARIAGSRAPADTDRDAAAAPAPDLETDKALARLGGDTELLEELEKDFLRQYPRKLRHIALCRDHENWDEAALAAHSLKNIAGAVGAEAARRMAGELEESLRRAEAEAATALLAPLAASLRRAGQLMDERPRPAAAPTA